MSQSCWHRGPGEIEKLLGNDYDEFDNGEYSVVSGIFEGERRKVTARTMFAMVKDINGKFVDGKAHVTCYSCHRGVLEPLTAPPPAPGRDVTVGTETGLPVNETRKAVAAI
jgi:hypothetical protein